jgi:nicotinamidase-related amidase
MGVAIVCVEVTITSALIQNNPIAGPIDRGIACYLPTGGTLFIQVSGLVKSELDEIQPRQTPQEIGSVAGI